MNIINIQNQEVTVKSIVESNTITVIPESENNVSVVQPITTVVEVVSPGPVGPTGPIGPTGPSTPFTNTTGSIFSTTSSLLITGSLNVTQGITGSLLGTASFALSASYAPGGQTSILEVQIFS